MPAGVEKELTKLIPRLYKKGAENLGLFFFVNAQRQIVPTITIDQAIRNYLKFIDEDNWDSESAITTFCRMQKEFYEDCKG